MKLAYTAAAQDSGRTVKHVLKNYLELSENLIKRMKYAGRITCNSVPVYVNVLLNEGDLVEADIDFDDEESDVAPEDLPLDIIYEDEWLIAVNKQPGMVVHPTSTHISSTVANALTYHMQKQGVMKKVRPVSRLDRDTTGIIIFAKNEYTQEHFIKQMAAHTFKKEYIGIVQGVVAKDKGTIDLPIDRMPGSIMLRHVSPTGSKAVTHYQVLKKLNGGALLRFELETGRTHQIRVHCKAMGFPLLGDTLYSDITTDIINRQALHSCNVTFIHPRSHELLALSVPIPSDMSLALEIMGK